MIYDRPYMRSNYGGDGDAGSAHPVLTKLLIANVAVYICQHVFISLFRTDFFQRTFSLSFANLSEFKVWTFITYGFLHDTGSLLHILFNLLGLFFIGRILEPIVGSRSFAVFYFAAILMGGLIWLSTGALSGAYLHSQLMGASAGVLALLMYFCLLFPDRMMTVLLFFVIPVQLKPKWIMWFILITEGVGLLQELSGGGSFLGIAHSAHLGGVLAAFILFKVTVRTSPSFGWGSDSTEDRVSIEPPRWLKNRKLQNLVNTKVKVNVTSRQAMEEEVNRILDKINKNGFGSLTLAEKETLDRARDFLKR